MPDFGCFNNGGAIFSVTGDCFVRFDPRGQAWLCAESRFPEPDSAGVTAETLEQFEADFRRSAAESDRLYSLLRSKGGESVQEALRLHGSFHETFRMVSAPDREALARELAKDLTDGLDPGRAEDASA